MSVCVRERMRHEPQKKIVFGTRWSIDFLPWYQFSSNHFLPPFSLFLPTKPETLIMLQLLPHHHHSYHHVISLPPPHRLALPLSLSHSLFLSLLLSPNCFLSRSLSFFLSLSLLCDNFASFLSFDLYFWLLCQTHTHTRREAVCSTNNSFSLQSEIETVKNVLHPWKAPRWMASPLRHWLK